MRKLELEQNTSDWLRWRAKGIGASDANIILGVSPWFSRRQLLSRKVVEFRQADNPTLKKAKGPVKREADNGAMARGRRLEPVVRKKYEDLMGVVAAPLCAIHSDIDWMRASLDGWIAEYGLVLEIKCPNINDHTTALNRAVPIKYHPQLQHQLMVTGAKQLHYVSYSDNKSLSSTKQLAIVTVKPSPSLQKRLLEEETRFWEELQEQLRKPEWQQTST